jgi:predicted transglutaminase-like cysteine proteinase
VWISRLVVIFLASLTGISNAQTDFARMERLAATEYGQDGATRVKAWRDMLERNRQQPENIRVDRANTFVNDHIHYTGDRDTWGAEDYWTTPLEALGKGRGDCEDYALTKYVSLLLMGVPVQKLRLVYVRARLGSQTISHMVLSYFKTPTDDPLILDNLIDRIFPATERPDLYPVFSFNHEGLWIGSERGSSGDPSARLSRWRDVLQRMRREGIDPSITRISARSSMSWKYPKTRPLLKKVAKSRSSSKLGAKRQAHSKTKKIASKRVASAKKRIKAAKSRPLSRRIARR